MKKKLKEILLIDDSKGLLSLSKRLLEEMNVAESITVALNGKVALDYLISKQNEQEASMPELIFLDINMPVMDGYQFLEKYKEEDIACESNIVMLTTSLNEIDKEKTKNYPCVTGYQSKPLKKESVIEILKTIS